MLGPPKPRCLDQPIGRSIEELVPRGHFDRFLNAKLDLTFVHTWVQERYADGGWPSIDPVVFFKPRLVMFFEGIRSERQLMRVVADRLSVRWYLGYHLDERLPDHSSLTRTRARLGLPVFHRFFAHVVELCQQAGLVRGRPRIVPLYGSRPAQNDCAGRRCAVSAAARSHRAVAPSIPGGRRSPAYPAAAGR
jgi:transposase